MKWSLVIAVFFMVFSFLAPNHYVPWLTSHSEFAIFAALMSLFFFTLFKQKLIIPQFILFYLFILIIPTIQFLSNRLFFFGDLLIIFVYIFGFFLSLLIGFNIKNQHIDKSENIYVVLSSIFVFASLSSVFLQLMQWLLLANGQFWLVDFPIWGRPFANFAQPNTLATFLSIGLIAVLYLFEKKYFNNFTAILISCLIIFGIALTQSRTAWVFAFVFLFWWLWKATKIPTRINTRQILSFIGFYIICIATLPYISSYLGVTGIADGLTRATTGLNRIAMWHQMLLVIKNQPWFGYGWNQVGVAQVMITLEYPVREYTEHAHNIILDIFIWNGIPIGLEMDPEI